MTKPKQLNERSGTRIYVRALLQYLNDVQQEDPKLLYKEACRRGRISAGHAVRAEVERRAVPIKEEFADE